MNSKFSCIAFCLCLPTILSCSLLIASKPSNSQIPKEASMVELKIVRNREDLASLNGKKVKLVGYYTSQSSKPTVTGNPDFKGVYIKSQIVLEDGTVVHIFPSWNKQSLRSPLEMQKYKGKIVQGIGVVEFEVASSINSQTRESFINLEEFKDN
ncbi:hypothetical protein [Calothrix sp. PCC 6303]|uniref:hypothetical protein n=1 Tax=Calothrix sp. PCC 6303 TaxID=1170562 RepID=UPI0005A1EE2C|nr:hypothetical protein [Calothrix sp. PCC 6303]